MGNRFREGEGAYILNGFREEVGGEEIKRLEKIQRGERDRVREKSKRGGGGSE